MKLLYGLVFFLFGHFLLSGQAINQYINDYVSASPNVASAQKFTDIQINTASGTAPINVPIHQLSEGPIQVNVSLNYHTGGIKLGETASWIGLGWNLSGGGMVSRTIQGRRDDDQYGYLHGECATAQSGTPSPNDLDAIVNGLIDCEADQFYVNLPGFSAKMTWAPGKQNGGGWYVYPHSEVKIEHQLSGYEISGFTITTPEGIRYILGENEVETTSYSKSPQTGSGSAFITSAWYLKRIESPDSLHIVYYSYEDEDFSIPSLGSNVLLENGIVNGGTCNSSSINETNLVNSYTFTNGKRLAQISCSSGTETINFIEDVSTRADIGAGTPPSSTPAKALERIEVSTGSFCKKYVLSQHYSNASASFPYEKRLILDQVDELSCDGSSFIPPYTFEYNDVEALPSRLSKQVDHWGYYNGKTTNNNLTSLIPGNASVTYQGQKYYYIDDNVNSGANRQPDSALMKKGALYKVNYPTGGFTDYLLEANQEFGCRRSGVYDYPVENRYSNCNPAYNQTDPAINLSAEEWSGAEFRLSMYLGNNGICPGGNNRFNVRVTAVEDVPSFPATHTYLYSINLPPDTIITPYMNIQDMFSPPLFPDMPYKFTLSVDTGSFYGVGEVKINVRYLPMENNIVGGLRVARTETYESATSSPIVTVYDYTDSMGHSTGVLLQEPQYGYLTTLNIGATVLLKKFSSVPLTGTTDMDGNTIVYKKVRQSKTGLGYNDYHYDPVKVVNTSYPVLPLQPTYKNDKLILSETTDQSGQLITSLSAGVNGYFVPDLSSYVSSPSKIYFVEKFTCNDLTAYLNLSYTLPVPSYAQNHTSISTMDGVSTITSRSFDATGQITSPLSESMTNSDGKVHTTTFAYTNTYPENTLKNALLSQNRLYPAWKTEKSVDGLLIDGSRSMFSFYTSTGQATTTAGNRIYPRYIDRYQMTWDEYNLPTTGVWQTKQELRAYDATSVLPKEIYREGYTNPITISYQSNHLPQSVSFLNHNTTFGYYGTSRLPSSSTAIDGQITTYAFDPLMRLSHKTERLGSRSDTIHYAYGSPANYTENISRFQPVAGSDLTLTKSRSFFDGLGRDIEQILLANSPDMKDVAAVTTYDLHGRQEKQSILLPTVQSTGNYISFTPGSYAASSTRYENNLLNRVAGQTPPSWYESTSTYSHNATSLTAPWGTVFAPQSLSLQIVTDPDGRKSLTYTDKLGRIIASSQCDNSLSTCATTWMLYDDKDREVVVYPPGSGPSDSELIFRKRYDGADNLIYLKKPDAVAEDFVYNSRNLPIGHRNGVLQDQGKWLVTAYDDYGRVSKTGLKNLTTPLPASEPIQIDEVLEEYFYDGFDGTNTNSSPIYKDKLRKKRTKVLSDNGTSNVWLESLLDYDAYGRVSTESFTNQLGNVETTTYSYDFADHVVGEVHQANFGGVAVNKVTSRTFDHQGRQKTEAVSINGGPAQEVCQLKYNYKSLITERNLGRFAPSGDRQFLQSIDYAFNNQNWLTKINNARSGNLLEFDYCGMEPGGESLIPMFPQSLSIITDDDLDLFYQEINYDQTIADAGITPHKNGNISTIKWHGPMKYDQVFTYDYDFLNRLSDVRHGELTNSGSTYTNKNHYDEDFGYDIRGNILTSNRKGLVKQAEIGPMCFEPQTIDSLAYSYHTGTNRLKQVVDHTPCDSVLQLPDTIFRDVIYAAPQIVVDQTVVDCGTDLHLEVGTNANILNDFQLLDGCDSTKVYVRQGPCPPAKFTEGFNQQSNTGEYTYDDSGNLVFDPNKKLSFAYNHLNLPFMVMAKSDTLFYDYAADGTLISEKYKNKQGLVKERQYLRGVELVNGQLEFLPHAAGRILNDGGTWRYEYTLKDHLGNTRFVICDKDSDGTIEQTMDALTNELLSERHYYSFGMELGGVWKTAKSNLPKNDYTYTGKEVVEEMGWDVLRLGARDYDPALGRMWGVDPLALRFPNSAPYVGMLNNPIRFNDPTGMSAESPIFGRDGKFLGLDSEGFSGEIILMDEDKYKYLTNNGEKTLDHAQVMKWADHSPHAQTLSDYVANDFDLLNGAAKTFLSKLFTNLINAANEDGLIDYNSESLQNGQFKVSNTWNIAHYNKRGSKDEIYIDVHPVSYSEYLNGQFSKGQQSLWFLNNSGDAINILGVHEPLHRDLPGDENHPQIDSLVKKNRAFGITTQAYKTHIKNRN